MTEQPDADTRVMFAGVHKYFGDFHVLQDINLEIRTGEKVIICGPSGSGKSTLIRCINRLEEVQKGRIYVNGRWLSSDLRDTEKVRREVGMVFQQFNLFPHLTVLDNLTLAPRRVRGLSRGRAEELAMAQLERVRIADQARKYPSQLSGGQQQRVAIARVLAGRPGMVLADEPVSRLDQENSRKVMELVCRPDGPQLVLSAMHDVSLALRYHDRIIGLKGGRLQFDLPATDVSDTLIRDLYEDDHG